MVDGMADRVQRLRQELDRDRIKYHRLGRQNYNAAYALTIVTVVSSAAAGILGLGFEGIPRKLVALVALIPAFAVTVASQFKWQEKANWHYRKHDAVKALLRRLNYELPCNPTEADLSELAKGYSVLEAEMTAAWEDLTFQVAAEDAAMKGDAKFARQGRPS